ncbi:DUF3857 domain-containing protein [Sabulilitoribacter multivorans]|uniref:DUF3857 domain-containing protein n=1 Tax=Flaviramulus multivorans TaxID=1304750 RepID=A0ABS9IGR1_9FLAO|nr:DUF3857 domain-containing protein [Flaviramulus multivorans]MCF7559701.1 DUF3857 domain-containing protein [Flaviramulus multivorans]
MLKAKFILVFILFTQLAFTQKELPFYTSYSWDKNPSYSMTEDVEDPIIALKDKILTEFYFQEEGLVEYFLEHRVLWLNSDDKIESYNKIYLPYTATSELKVNKARVIKKNGEIVELDDSKILTAQDEETGQNYKYFAFEGIEKGSFIEYYYVVRRYPRYKGNKITFQTDYKKNNVEFDLYSPNNLIFEFKTYNDTPDIKQDTLSENKLHWQLHIDSINSLNKEDLSAYNASKKAVVYKLDKNTADNSKDISSYGKVAQNIYSYYYEELNGKTQNLLNKFVLEATNGKDLNEEEALIRKLEFFIKSNVYITKDDSDSFKDLNNILDKKIANETGILKLYLTLFKSLNIKHEIVITSDRQDLKFDKDFEANNFLTDFLIYFNKSKKYLSPHELDSRYGFPPAFLTNNYGLFIKEVKVGDFVSGLGKIKYIKSIEADKTVDRMIIDVDFDKDNISNCSVKLDRSMAGYYAMYFQPYMHLIKDKDRDDLIEGFAKNINENIDITNKQVLNDDPELFGVKPIQFKIDFNTEALSEKAGNKYLFKAGELIGEQMQLYQEKERILPVENEFTRSYYRTINIKIPEGYKIANLDDINIKNYFTKNGEELLIFHSYYELSGNDLVITADEHYRENIIETENYEDYRTVINSAADFNKLVLVFEPI